ncbi:NEDD8 protease nep2 [Homalodisca vitripennis]|nr:NEDD8 protease nep2 [Homalodisca vitripennis]KAG8279510.1 NEDD8 protease nep2 [Homalodisca vitripennis]
MRHDSFLQGSQFDYKGDLNDWWEAESKENFNEKKMCIIDQYGSYKDSQTQLNSTIALRPLIKERSGHGGYMTVSGGVLLASQLGPLILG